jgi:ATP-dependent DNA helicase RecG
MKLINEKNVPENLPDDILNNLKLVNRFKAYSQIHFPANMQEYDEAVKRLKFEELFIAQLRMARLRSQRHRFSKGVVFEKVGDLFNNFYTKYLPFELTGAQKRVIKEIRKDTATGKQMNRLLARRCWKRQNNGGIAYYADSSRQWLSKLPDGAN